jgi:hypothetical protein
MTALMIAGLVVGGRSFIAEWVVSAPRHWVPLYFFLMLWLSATAFLLLAMVWVLFGAQVVSIRGDNLAIKNNVAQTKIGRQKAFATDGIENLRIEERTYKIRGNATAKSVITFDYRGQRQNLVTHLSAERAESLLNDLLRRLPHQCERTKTSHTS